MRRKKATISDFNAANIYYTAYQRVKHPEYGLGYRYIIDKPLSIIQRAAMKQWENVFIGTCYYRYAPEIKYNTITLFDKCIKK